MEFGQTVQENLMTLSWILNVVHIDGEIQNHFLYHVDKRKSPDYSQPSFKLNNKHHNIENTQSIKLSPPSPHLNCSLVLSQQTGAFVVTLSIQTRAFFRRK